MFSDIDVVIVGAGPVGLMLAIELTIGGARVLVLERLPEPSLTMKAFGIGPLGSEVLRRRGMGAALDAAEAQTMAVISTGAAPRRGKNVSGHFAGLFLLRADAQSEPERRMRMVDQQSLEAMLGARAAALGIVIRRGCDIAHVAADPEGVDVTWRSPSGEDRVRAAYLVGCDGGRSAVRKMTGFAFPGTPPTMTMVQAVVTLDHPERLGPPGWHHTAEGVFANGPFPRRLVMLDFSGPPTDRQAPVTRDEVEAMLRRISGADVRVTVLDAANRWADNTRLVDTYRQGRVFLAGDAAHVHSPFGGQGLSLGLVDAANLGWKLAAVIRGESSDDMLDSYEAERRPMAEAVLANTLAQAAIMRPDPQSAAMRNMMARLLGFDDVNRFVGGMMTGTAVRYDLGSEDDRVGRLIGDRPFPSGTASLYTVLEDGRGLLLDATPDGAAARLLAEVAPPVSCLAVTEGPSMLIRPDGCVAWVDAGNLMGLAEALRRWFGHPSPCVRDLSEVRRMAVV